MVILWKWSFEKGLAPFFLCFQRLPGSTGDKHCCFPWLLDSWKVGSGPEKLKMPRLSNGCNKHWVARALLLLKLQFLVLFSVVLITVAFMKPRTLENPILFLRLTLASFVFIIRRPQRGQILWQITLISANRKLSYVAKVLSQRKQNKCQNKTPNSETRWNTGLTCAKGLDFIPNTGKEVKRRRRKKKKGNSSREEKKALTLCR